MELSFKEQLALVRPLWETMVQYRSAERAGDLTEHGIARSEELRQVLKRILEETGIRLTSAEADAAGLK